MGSSASKYYDEQDRLEWEENKEWLDRVAEEIKSITSSMEIDDLKFIIKNKEKILRNRRLIELIG